MATAIRRGSSASWQGWRNRPTWLVNMWLTRDHELHQLAWRTVHERSARAAAKALRELVEFYGPTNLDETYPRVYSDLLGWALDLVDYDEIVRAWKKWEREGR